MEEVLQVLGKRIREIRIERGFASQEALAERLGFHRTFVGHLETGRKDFRLSTLIRVAQALDVGLAELFQGGNIAPKSRGDVKRGERLRELAAVEKSLARLKRLA